MTYLDPSGQGRRDPGEQRNLLIAIVLTLLLLFGYEVFIGGPQMRERQAEQAAREAAEQAQEAASPEEAVEEALRPRELVLAASISNRVSIDTPSVDGTLNLTGARFDDLNLRNYRTTVDGNEEVTLLSPRGSEHGFDAVLGWEERDSSFQGVGADAQWTAEPGARLTPDQPLVLRYTSDDGLQVERTISVDDNYMFTVADVVTNTSQTAREVRPYGVVRRQNLPEGYRQQGIVHQGFTGVFGPEQRLHEVRYERANKHASDRDRGRVGADERIIAQQGEGGWLGVTDHYWLAAVAPAQSETIEAFYDTRRQADYTDYRAAYAGEFRSIAPGESVSYTQHLFAGAKRVEVLRAYEEALGLPNFDKAVDWGNFWFLTRPFFALLEWFFGFVGNFGVAILLSTIVIKALLFPLVYHSYKAMAKLREVGPRIKELQERYKADQQRQMQEMQRLYQTEKINPVAGCLPILLQIPVFYALYKTLTVTIEMRHAPFFGWIRDLSAPDPLYITNLFGLLPYDPASVPLIGSLLAIGVWPILYAISMYMLQSLSPPPPDKIQATVFKFLPLLFLFLFANFAAGLVIYWTWSNTLSILQQYVIMRRQGVKTELDKFLERRFGKDAAAAK